MSTLDGALAWAADLAPDQPAVREWESGRTVSYRTLDQWVTSLAAFIRGQGTSLGDRVGIHLPNCAEFLVAQFGATRAGCVASYVNYRLTADEAARQMKLAEVKVIVTTAERAADLRAVPELARTVYVLTDGNLPLGHSIADIVSRTAATGGMPGVVLDEEDAIARFTSGSTGAPKGVLVSHRAWLIRATSLLTEVIKVDPFSTTMVLGPLSHQAGLFVLPTIFRCGTLLVFAKFDIDKVTAALKTRTVRRTQMVPTMLQMFLTNPAARDAFGQSGLQQVIYGGSPVQEQVIGDALGLMPACDFVQSYGSHEAGSISHLDGPAHRDPKWRSSAGRPLLAASVRIAPRDGGFGEIEVRAPWTPRARITEKGRESVTEDWIPTGDLGEMVDGYIFLKDRANDVIISGGFNIYPLEVEAAINADPMVLTCAVASRPDAKWGEKVIAFVVPRVPGVFDEAALRDRCRQSLSPFKIPKEFHLLDSIPTNANGKPDRRKLSDPLWLGAGRRIN